MATTKDMVTSVCGLSVYCNEKLLEQFEQRNDNFTYCVKMDEFYVKRDYVNHATSMKRSLTQHFGSMTPGWTDLIGTVML